MKYRVNLIDNDGCNFDNGEFNNIKTAKDFARGRCGNYTVYINGIAYTATNNRINWGK